MSSKKRFKKFKEFTNALGIDPARSLEAEIKANLTGALIKEIEKQNLTHDEVAEYAGVARSTVTGIVNGSLQSVSIDRLLRILSALGMSVEIKVKKSA
jgi:predicted XRE-type DNA-binding protein